MQMMLVAYQTEKGELGIVEQVVAPGLFVPTLGEVLKKIPGVVDSTFEFVEIEAPGAGRR